MLEQVIKHYPDFPKPGIDFIDVLPFLQDKAAFTQAAQELGLRCTAANVTAIEARGFLFASPLLAVADHVKALLPVRKKGKIPHAEGDLRKVEVQKEYGADELYYRPSDLRALVPNGDRVEITLLDDFLATGGTALELARALEREVVDGKPVKVTEFVFIAELPDLGGRHLLEPVAPVHTLMSL